jgi:hypothetical protein
VAAMCDRVEELVRIENGTAGRRKVPWLARQMGALPEESEISLLSFALEIPCLCA